MAVTKIIPVKVNIKACIKYVINEKKTEEQTLTYGHGCSADASAETFFEMANSQNSKCRNDQKPNLAYHFIQSFSPEDNITPEKALELGQKYIQNLLGGEYAFVMATHVDKEHIHNHFCVCASKMDMSGRKLKDDLSLIHKMQKTSDAVCREAGLSVITDKGGKAKKYKEWLEDKTNPKGSHRTELKNDIDESIRECKSYDDFLIIMQQKGYKIESGNTKKTESGKYNSFIKEEWIKENPKARPLRDFTLDKKNNRYTIDKIEERIEKRLEWIEQKAQERAVRKANMTTAEKKVAYNTLRGDSMYEKQEITKENLGKVKWQQNQNRLLFTKIMNDAQEKYGLSFTEFASRLEDIKSTKSELQKEQNEINGFIESMQKGIAYAEVYLANKTLNQHYNNAADKDKYFREHESRLLAYDEADRNLFIMGINANAIDRTFIEEMKAKLDNMREQSDNLEKQLSSLTAEESDLAKWQKDMDIYLGKTHPEEETKEESEPEKAKEKGKNEPTL